MEGLKQKCGMYLARGGFDKSLNTLYSNSLDPVSMKDYVKAVYNNPPRSVIELEGSFVKEGAVYIPGRKILLVKDSPLIERATAKDLAAKLRPSWEEMKKETNALFKSGEWDKAREIENNWALYPLYISNANEYLDIVEEDRNKSPKDRRALDATKYFTDKSVVGLPADKVSEHELFQWALGDKINQYLAMYIQDKNSRDIWISIGNSNIRDMGNSPHARQIWFSPAENEIMAARNDKHLLFGRFWGKAKQF